MRIRIKKGLDIPIGGRPNQEIHEARPVRSVALLGADTHGLKPGMAVRVGDRVRLGQTLYTDKQNPEVKFTSPGCGEIAAINRGERRVLQSVVVRLDGDAEETFDSFPREKLDALRPDDVRENLLASGLWTAFRRRPFSKIPPPNETPHSIFVTAIDTNPLAADPVAVIAAQNESFIDGCRVVSRLTDGRIHICTAADAAIELPQGGQFDHCEFAGPHPAGLVGTHIHFLAPVGAARAVWHLGYQDAIAIGRLFTSGRLPVERVVALGGPLVRSPRLLRARAGASTTDLLQGEVEAGRMRVLSGSVLSGHRAAGWAAWLGRYHNQISVLAEGGRREFLNWMMPGAHKYSSARAYTSHVMHRGDYALTTSQNGSPRAMVPIGSFEKVMPLDILPTQLLKALIVDDTDSAQALGCLELDEEDLALCSFVCNGKYEYGPHLRRNLADIEVNG